MKADQIKPFVPEKIFDPLPSAFNKNAWEVKAYKATKDQKLTSDNLEARYYP